MKRAFKFLGIALLATAVTLTSCDDDDPEPLPTPEVIENLENGIMEGTLTENYVLNPGQQYVLQGSFIVPEGIEFTIPAGTNIKAINGGTDVYLAVLMGGKININGTESHPVVMSSAGANPGDWGGLTICGRGITTAGEGAEAEVGGFLYGGTNATDNSGSVSYLVIRGTGAQINSESQYNGVSLYAVGSGTTLNNIAVINGADDGIEFFGGSANVTNLFLQNNEDDAIDWTEGWNGTVTNSYVEHTIAGFSTVVEADKDNANPKLINLTAVSTTGGTALQFKKESGATITGLHIDGYAVELDMKDGGPIDNVIVDGAKADVELISGETKKYTFKSGADSTPIDISGWTWKDADL